MQGHHKEHEVHLGAVQGEGLAESSSTSLTGLRLGLAWSALAPTPLLQDLLLGEPRSACCTEVS